MWLPSRWLRLAASGCLFPGQICLRRLEQGKIMMKQWVLGLSLLAAAGQNSVAAVEWVTDVHEALLRATSEHKAILLDFTGSDWCGWCMKLKSEVFDQPEFAAYAQANLIMVEVDFPRHKELSPEQQAANDKLARTYSIRGYPTVILLDASGKQIGHGGYVPGGPKNFIAALESNPDFGHHRTPDSPAPPAQPDSPRPPAAFVPVAPANALHYGDLALKGISGVKDHRLALINNQTLMIGETAKVKVHDQRVEITLKEIRDDSVVILVEGKTLQLTLGER